MLAEKRDKEIWSEDPQNSRWSRDKSKYGFRMLEQMGWREGKGLGLNEDGDTKHVKISKKKDNHGVGNKRGRDADWIERQDAFDQMLADLNAAQSQAPLSKSSPTDSQDKKTLADNAAQAKKIVYKKFLRSKDLSAQTSEDLDCVFGRKRRKKSNKTACEDILLPSEEESRSSCTHGVVTTTNNQSVQEYFSLKMAALKEAKNEEQTGKTAKRTSKKGRERRK